MLKWGLFFAFTGLKMLISRNSIRVFFLQTGQVSCVKFDVKRHQNPCLGCFLGERLNLFRGYL